MNINEIYKKGTIVNNNLSYGENNFAEASDIIKNLVTKKELILIIEDKSLESTIAIIGALLSKRNIILIDELMAKIQINDLLKRFNPNAIIGSKSCFNKLNIDISLNSKYFCIFKINNIRKKFKNGQPLLLVGTSGSSGATKFVGLTHDNLFQNCKSICKYLGNNHNSISINSLPCSYSYGLSVLNTTMYKGGKFIISNEKSFLRKEFWDDAKFYNITDFSGVPTTYKTLMNLDMNKLLPKTIIRITQAGGKLDIEIQKKLLILSRQRNCQFFVMYGQTEATARLSYINLTKEPHKIGSIGRVIPNVILMKPKNTNKNIEEELVFKGKNISLGYFNNITELEDAIDQNKGILKTGDLGFIDKDNCITITGRKSRFCKIDGRRISLDSIEMELLKDFSNIAVVSNDEKLFIVSEDLDSTQQSKIKQKIRSFCSINKTRISFMQTNIPLTNSGKISYSKLLEKVLIK